MKKKNFVSMILSAAGGILFAMGMCMCLLPECLTRAWPWVRSVLSFCWSC